MDWQELAATYPRDKDQSSRTRNLLALAQVRDGKQYDSLPHPFSRERSEAGEYVPLTQRRPAVRSGLCRSVVDDAVSLLFGEDHFPAVTGTAATELAALIRESCLPSVMIDAATRGSIGSVAVQMCVVDGVVSFQVLETAYLTPVWNRARPTVLDGLTERYKVRGSDLAANGYAIARDDHAAQFWFQRQWTATDEFWFLPQSMADAGEGKRPIVDEARSVNHDLGFVPVVWIRNLPGADGPDGACTFEAAISTTIEIDYLLSQGGRGLKYASDPTLVVKSGPAGSQPAREGGAATALTLPPEGDAKLLEINGSAASTILEQVRYLRSLALEAMHGNRSDADRVQAAQSGRSQELMHQALCWLAGRMRLSYGEHGLLALLRMVCRASQVMENGIVVGDQAGMKLDPSELELRWPAYFKATNADLLANAQALVTAVDGGILSQETAVGAYANMTDVDDAAGELARIRAEQIVSPTTDPAQVRKDANAGKTETRQATA